MTLSESLTDICLELNNWFDRGQRCFGTFAVSNKELSGFSDKLKPGQFYRIIGSVFNDGVHQYGDAALTGETFDLCGENGQSNIPLMRWQERALQI